MKYCTNCGAKLPDNAAFCPSCGQKINDIGASPKETPTPVEPVKGVSSFPEEKIDNDKKVAAMDVPGNKAALASFIIALIGFLLVETGLLGIILGGVALGQNRKGRDADRKPFTVFNKVAKPFAVLSLVFGILMIIFWFVYLIIVVIYPLIAVAIEEAMNGYLFLF